MTRRRAVIAAAALVVVALAVWWLRRPEPRRSEPATTAEPARPSLPPARPEAPAGPSPTPRAEPVRLTPATAAADPAAAHGVFAGRVVDWRNGKAVAGAEITFERDGAATSVRSSDKGEFELRPEAPGVYRLAVATAGGYLPYAPDWGHSPIELVARPGVRIDGIVVYLTPAIDYAGVVVSPDGEPVAGAAVRVLDARVGERALLPIEADYTTDARGGFSFHAPDDAVLEATHGDYAPGRARLDGDAQISRKLKIQLGPRGGAAPARATIAGRVVDGAGEPVADAMVSARPVGMSRRGHGDAPWAPQAISGPDGRFAIADVDPGDHALEARHRDHSPGRAIAAAGARDVILELGASGFVRGRVVTADGAPVPAFTIAVVVRPAPLREGVVAHASVFDGEGRFEVGGLPADGSYWVRAVAHGYAQSDAFKADVAAEPGAATPVLVTLRRGGVLVGKVVSSDGARPLESAKVTVEGGVGEGPSALPITATATTDERGEFELAGLVPGLASVVAGAFDHHPKIVSGLQVADGARLGPITIELDPVAEGEQPQLELAGIGAALGAVDDGLIVQTVFAGGGADAAGLVPGDVITAVDGAAVLELGFQGAIQRIRGPIGTSVRLTVRRADGQVGDVVATRQKVRA